jgi:hypothetical protein
MSIKAVPCRAEISIGQLTVRTPYVQSFTVRRARGQVGTFDASLKVSHEEINGDISGGNAIVRAGVRDDLTTIFTGVVKSAKISPCFDDPHYVILSVQGCEYLGFLAGKKYTRRCRATNGLYCTIQSVVRRGLKSGKFAYDKEAHHFSTESGKMEAEQPNTKATSVQDAGSIPTATAGHGNTLADVRFGIQYQPPTTDTGGATV